MLDRFGKLPESVEYLIKTARIRVCAESLGFLKVETQGNILKLQTRGGKNQEYFRMNGNFPRLTKRNANAKLIEIENFLTNVVPSIRKL